MIVQSDVLVKSYHGEMVKLRERAHLAGTTVWSSAFRRPRVESPTLRQTADRARPQRREGPTQPVSEKGPATKEMPTSKMCAVRCFACLAILSRLIVIKQRQDANKRAIERFGEHALSERGSVTRSRFAKPNAREGMGKVRLLGRAAAHRAALLPDTFNRTQDRQGALLPDCSAPSSPQASYHEKPQPHRAARNRLGGTSYTSPSLS